ncbi:hypothetical protein ZWY2020_045832 [Hordeum vulgare]|nr:hypothetical protein ZWY2020_045832 [Hordeum vulgare]
MIPQELTNCGRLYFLDIRSNIFGDDVQDIVGNFMSLKYLVLHRNKLHWRLVASGVLMLPVFARLGLNFNEFTGKLPPEVADMKSLKYLMLTKNNFSGRIPLDYGRLAEVKALDVCNNRISGGIPASIGNICSLIWLMLIGNQLSEQYCLKLATAPACSG